MQRVFNLQAEKKATLKIGIAFLVLISIFIFGSIGYHLIENFSWFEGFYMTFITISTIGFTEIRNLSVEGRIFTVVVFIMGIGVISYIASQSTQLLFESELFFKRAMEKQLEKMENHYIICGYGRIGHRIAQDLKDADLPVVIVENRQSSIERIQRDKLAYVDGDAQDEESLLKAGIIEAKGLICTLSSDQDNVFTTLLARELRPDIFILVRTNETKNQRKILRAGANKVVSPYDIGADRMANVILRPNVDQFLDKMTRNEDQDHTFEEVMVAPDSVLTNKSLAEINLRSKYSVLIIAIIKNEGAVNFNPSSETVIEAGNSMIILGDPSKIKDFRIEVCKDTRTLSERAENVGTKQVSK